MLAMSLLPPPTPLTQVFAPALLAVPRQPALLDVLPAPVASSGSVFPRWSAIGELEGCCLGVVRALLSVGVAWLTVMAGAGSAVVDDVFGDEAAFASAADHGG